MEILCLCVGVCTYVDVHVDSGGQPWVLVFRCHLPWIFFFNFETGSFPGLEFTTWVRLAGQQAPGIWLSLPSQCWGPKCTTTSTRPSPHPWDLGLDIVCLRQTLSRLSYLPRPQIWLLTSQPPKNRIYASGVSGMDLDGSGLHPHTLLPSSFCI